jgi:DinB family protein
LIDNEEAMMADLQTREDLLAALEQERAALLELLPRFSDEGWRTATRDDGWTAHDIATHLADANYGLALMALGEITPPMQLDQQTGWMSGLNEYNQQRREKNAALPREKVLSRSAKALDEARRAIETIENLDAPGPYGPVHTKRQWLQRIVLHTRQHRRDLEQLL